MNLLTVQDPDESATEVATDTRARLQEWADKHLPAGEEGGIKALADELVKSLRAIGASSFTSAQAKLAADTRYTPQTEFGKLLAAFAAGTCAVYDQFSLDYKAREFSHAFEGLVREFHKQFFSGGMKWNLHAEYLAVCSIQSPCRTSGAIDGVWWHCMGTDNLLGNWHSTPARVGARDESEWVTYWRNLRAQTRTRFESIGEWLVSQARNVVVGEEGMEYWCDRLAGFDYVGVQVHYMDEDGPWVAGFLNLDDACKLRFRRIRLGAYLAEQGMGDGEVRDRVERAKQHVAGATFEAYPNDCEWTDLYTSGPGSCMADPVDEYQTWDDIHPVSVYSSAYHGAGDNSLALLISRDEDGTITGRGILNLQRGTIVRWYGDNVAERVLLRNGVDVSDRKTLKDSWLAHLSQGKRFIHPYVDGDYGAGFIEDGRIYIGDEGFDLQETSGSSFSGNVHYCEDTERYEDADDAVYQEGHENYVTCDADWQCPVTGEYNRPYNRTTMNLHGVREEVSDLVYYSASRYLTNTGRTDSYGSPIYSIDDSDMREAFLSYHDIDEDESEEDEEAA